MAWNVSDPTLLVIEDARDQALLVRVAARMALPGLDVRVAGDGKEGIGYLDGAPPFQDRRSHPTPDLILLDLLMPEVDGFDVLEWLGEARGLSHIPVVVLTASSNPAHESRAAELGATAFYHKPEDLDRLGRLVRDIVETWLPPTEEAAGSAA